MASFPAVNGRQTIRALEELGFRLERIEGSHHMMVIRTRYLSLCMAPSPCPPALSEASFAWRV
jgi:predicted RNA binding protein YcfA (HicA-like mRNA interferase family)